MPIAPQADIILIFTSHFNTIPVIHHHNVQSKPAHLILPIPNIQESTRFTPQHQKKNPAITMPPIPKTMSGVLIEENGGVEVLQWKTDLPVPELKEGEVLVRNEFIGVNYIDTYAPPLLPSRNPANPH